MIILEMPTHQLYDYLHIRDAANKCKYPDQIGFAMSLNGKELNKSHNIVTQNFAAEHFELQITEPCISMVEVRSQANEVATKHFNPKYRILSDHNFIFNKGWEDFLLAAVDDMELFTRLTKRLTYMGMGGTFGSYRHGSKAFLGPQPVFPCGRGIIYTMADVYSKMEKLPSSLEEQYLCSILFHEGHVPLRKMMSPIHHTMVNDGVHGIHNKALIDKYNSAIVRKIWSDPNWMSKPTYSGNERPPKGKYYSHSPMKALTAMRKLKIEMARFPGVIDNFLVGPPGAKCG